jgi:hypothetical protein
VQSVLDYRSSGTHVVLLAESRCAVMVPPPRRVPVRHILESLRTGRSNLHSDTGLLSEKPQSGRLRAASGQFGPQNCFRFFRLSSNHSTCRTL